MSRWKQTLSVLLAAAMLCSSLPGQALAAGADASAQATAEGEAVSTSTVEPEESETEAEQEAEASEAEPEASEPEQEVSVAEAEASEPEQEVSVAEAEASEPEQEASETGAEASEPEQEASVAEAEASEPKQETSETEAEASETEPEASEVEEAEGSVGIAVSSEEAEAASDDAEAEEELVYDLDGLLVSDNSEEDMNSWRFEDGEPIEVETEDSNDGIMIVDVNSSDSVAFGIDVSKWQGDIDWDSARSSISFAIIRCGYGSNLTSHDDAYFEANVEACEELGIPYGVYLYSYATSTTEAKSEANHVLRLLEGHTPSLPVYLDLEDSSITSACTNKQILTSTEVFCNAIEAAGYEAGVYANKYWWTTYLTSSSYDQWDRWVAQYNTSCTYTGGSFSYWQYSSTGSVSGISGNVDCNYALSGAPFYNSSTPKIANADLPSGSVTATTYTISGIVSSSKKITKITVSILDSSGTTVQTATAKPNGKSYELAAMNFSVSTMGLTAGKTYTCQVKATTSSGTATVTETTFKVAAPQLTSVSNEATGVKVIWKTYTGAAKYRVFRKVSGGSWEKVGDTTSTSYTDTTAVSGTTYIYTVRCINSAGTSYTSSYDTTGLTITYIAAPVISRLSSTIGGVTVTWGAVTGAEKYRIYRKVSSTSWVVVGNTTATTFTDTTAVSGAAYTYTVRCISSDGATKTSGYTSGKSITYIATPTLSSLEGTTTGVKVTWGKVSGAVNYRVYRKVPGGSWVRVGETTSTTLTDTTTVSGTTYTYTVRCINAAGTAYASDYDATGKTITYIAAPVISRLSSTTNGVAVTWEAVTGAEKYRIYRKVSSTSWVVVGNTTATTFTDTTAVSGAAYTYTVRCISSDGATKTSGYTSGKSITYIATPTLSSLEGTTTGVKVTWGKVSGAVNYRVYRKVPGGSWVRVGETTSTTLTDTTAVSGTTYTYTVRCINAAGTAYVSDYDATGKSITYTLN